MSRQVPLEPIACTVVASLRAPRCAGVFSRWVSVTAVQHLKLSLISLHEASEWIGGEGSKKFVVVTLLCSTFSSIWMLFGGSDMVLQDAAFQRAVVFGSNTFLIELPISSIV